MIKNYLKTALRNLARHKGNSIVNIAGLAVGFAAFLLIFLIIRYEQSFDGFHTKKDKIYRVVRVGRNALPGECRTGVPAPVTKTLRTDFPELTNVGSIAADGNVQVIVTGKDGLPAKKFREASGVFFAESQFFHMFDFGLAAGNINDALEAPGTGLLTKDLATKYFGDWKAAMGQTIKVDGLPVKITGILNNIPPNTDFPIKAVLSYATLRNYMSFENWGSINDQNYCFVQLAENASPQQFQPLLSRFTDTHIKHINPNYDLVLQPLSEIHYDERFGNFSGHTFSKDLILALSLIGLFLLIVACVNFINLTTAQAMNRAREVGVRKVLGGRRAQLVAQFLGETGITCVLALGAAIILTYTCIPPTNKLLDIQLSLSVLFGSKVLALLFGGLLAVTFLSGFYPALILSGFNVISVLKSTVGGDRRTGASFRRGLVVFQFVIAQALIITTLVVASQMDYFRNADMGFNKTAIINAGFPNDSTGLTKIDALRSDLLKVAGIGRVSFSMSSPATGGGSYTDLRTATNHTKNADMIVNMKLSDTDFFRVYQLPLVAGRIYHPADTLGEFVVNETVIRKLGIQHPEDAIGRMVNVNGADRPIVGVVKDFHVNSLRDPIDPVVMTTMKGAYGMVNVNINLHQAKAVIAAMGDTWNKYFPDYSFEYSFLDQDIAAFYQQENQLSVLYTLFSGIAIFISCLGLYGLISFMAVQRKKEIGIRKVLGAPVSDIVVMMSKEFTILVSIAFLIASPIAWYFMKQWLQHYTYRISMGPWFFAITIAGSLCIAWITVGYTAVKAALANPVNSLRAE